MIGRHVHTLLDAGAMERFLHSIPVLADGTARLNDVTLDRVGVKPGRSFHTLYRIGVETDAGTVETRAWAALLTGDQGLSKAHRKALKGADRKAPTWCRPSWSARRSTGVVDSPPMLVQLFPWDYRLPTLPLALDPARVGAGLAGIELRSCALAGYWPGSRCQILYHRRDNAGVVYGKVFLQGAGETACRNLEAIWGGVQEARLDGLVTPRVRAYLPGFDLLVTEPVAGEPLPNLMDAGGCSGLMAGVAAALAAFHALRIPGIERRFRPADDIAIVRSWSTLVGVVFPSLAGSLDSGLAALERRFPDDEQICPVLVHRDFYENQIVVGPSRMGMLDLDTVCLGDGEIDVGNFCAHLILRSLRREEAAFEASSAVRQEFVDAYRRLRTVASMPLITWYLASALLRLACVHAVRPRWHALAPPLIEASRQVLEE